MDADEQLTLELQRRKRASLLDLSPKEVVELGLEFAVWIPAQSYLRAPWLAPYAIRKARVRLDSGAPGPKRDLWGLPNEQGLFTDDNSLIKAVPLKRRLSPEDGPFGAGAISSGLVCCHIWAGTTAEPLLFSFIPNLVWLPKSLAPYTDAHNTDTPHLLHESLKVASMRRYQSVSPLIAEERVSQAWRLLPEPDVQSSWGAVHKSPQIELADADAVWRLAQMRTKKFVRFLQATLEGERPRRFSKRYHAGVGPGIDSSALPVFDIVTKERRQELVDDLSQCILPSTSSRKTSTRRS